MKSQQKSGHFQSLLDITQNADIHWMFFFCFLKRLSYAMQQQEAEKA